jgi:hypothetical protein
LPIGVFTILSTARCLQQADRISHRLRAEMHVLLRRRQILVARELLIARAAAPFIAKCEEKVCRPTG